MPATTIKVPVELRDRLAELAQRQHTSMAGAIAAALDAAEDAEFWRQVRTTMQPRHLPVDAEALDTTVSDGLALDEIWDDVL